LVKKRPVSNSSEVIGATAMPQMPAISAARPKLSSVMRGTSMPMRRAAMRFSAQARNAMPSVVRWIMNHSARMMDAAMPVIQKPCVGMRIPAISTGASPEKGGSA
jgi:hypothetical protein